MGDLAETKSSVNGSGGASYRVKSSYPQFLLQSQVFTYLLIFVYELK